MTANQIVAVRNSQFGMYKRGDVFDEIKRHTHHGIDVITAKCNGKTIVVIAENFKVKK